MVPVFYRSVTGFDVLLIGVLRVSGGDGVVETLSEGIGVAGGEAGCGDGVADDDEERAGVQCVDVDGKQLIGSDEGEGN